MKTADLTGSMLDYWVAKAEALPLCEEWNSRTGEEIAVGTGHGDLRGYAPSHRWSDGGPIIERERIIVAEEESDGSFVAGVGGRIDAGGDAAPRGEWGRWPNLPCRRHARLRGQQVRRGSAR